MNAKIAYSIEYNHKKKMIKIFFYWQNPVLYNMDGNQYQNIMDGMMQQSLVTNEKFYPKCFKPVINRHWDEYSYLPIQICKKK